MLRVEKISIPYRRVPVVRRVSFAVNGGQIVSIVGSNGAGKSTILRCVAGLIQPSDGRIEFAGEFIRRDLAHRIAKRGLCLVPEGARVFSKLSVQDNLRMGTFATKRPGYVAKDVSEMIYKMFPILLERRQARAETLSGGERQMLAIGRALMSQPKLLMLDEPTAGLSPKLAEEVFELITEIRRLGIAILMVEQQVEYSLEIADHAYVLENGEIVMEGKGTELLGSEMIKQAYLGL